MKPDIAQLQKIYTAWVAAVQEISDVEGLYPTFVINVLPSSAMSVAANNGVGNTWGLDDDQSLIRKSTSLSPSLTSFLQFSILTSNTVWQCSTGWANQVDDLRMLNWAQSFIDYWHQENQALDLASEFIYMGDAGDFQDPFAGFPVENVRRMREVRDAYDAGGVFSRLNWGGFKLGA